MVIILGAVVFIYTGAKYVWIYLKQIKIKLTKRLVCNNNNNNNNNDNDNDNDNNNDNK